MTPRTPKTKRPTHHRGLGMALACALMGACSAIPQPVPIPAAPVQSLLRAEGGTEKASDIRLVGLPGTVSGSGSITIDGREFVEVRSNADGSFHSQVLGAVDDILSIRFEKSDPASYRILPTAPFNIMRVGAPELASNGPITPDSSGNVHFAVTSTLARDGVLAINERGGVMSFVAEANDSGQFELSLPAETGDSIQVHANTNPLSPALELTVQ